MIPNVNTYYDQITISRDTIHEGSRYLQKIIEVARKNPCLLCLEDMGDIHEGSRYLQKIIEVARKNPCFLCLEDMGNIYIWCEDAHTSVLLGLLERIITNGIPFSYTYCRFTNEQYELITYPNR